MVDFYKDQADPTYLATITDDMVKAASVPTKEWMEFMDDGVRQVYNDQKTGAVISDGDEDVQVNGDWPAMMQEVAVQAQRRAMVLVEPHDPEQMDEAAANIWKGVLQHQYVNDLNMQEINKEAAIDAFIYGVYIAKVLWDQKAEWDLEKRIWIRRPVVNLMHPPFFGADPEAEKIDRSTPYVYSGRRVSIDWILQRWGDTPAMRAKILEEVEKDPYNSDSGGGGANRLPRFGPMGTSETNLDGANQRENQGDLRRINRSNRGRLANLIERSRGMAQNQDIRNYSGTPRNATLLEVYWRDMTAQQQQDVKEIPGDELIADGSV